VSEYASESVREAEGGSPKTHCRENSLDKRLDIFRSEATEISSIS